MPQILSTFNGRFQDKALIFQWNHITTTHNSIMIFVNLVVVLVIPLLFAIIVLCPCSLRLSPSSLYAACMPCLQKHFEAFLINCYFKLLPHFFFQSANPWAIGVKTLTLIDLLCFWRRFCQRVVSSFAFDHNESC